MFASNTGTSYLTKTRVHKVSRQLFRLKVHDFYTTEAYFMTSNLLATGLLAAALSKLHQLMQVLVIYFAVLSGFKCYMYNDKVIK